MDVQNMSPLVIVSFFVSFMKKKLSIKFCGVFYHFLRAYEVGEIWMIKLYLHTSDVIHANEHTKYANCGLHGNFYNFLLMPFCKSF